MLLRTPTRFSRSVSHFSSPDDIIETAAFSFRLDKWKDQTHHVEVFIEKDALIGVIKSICRKLDVAYMSCRGYMSLSTMWETAQRLKWYTTIDKQITIVHLGDHDPSGVHMSQDIENRLSLFMGHKAAKKLTVNRIALNMDQVEQYNPPPSPAKLTDTRAKGYIEEFETEDSWELDALDPKTIADLIEDAVTEVRDEIVWDATVIQEQDDRRHLRIISQHFDHIANWVEDQGFSDETGEEAE